MSARVFIWLLLSLDWAEIVRIIFSSANGICRARASTGCTKLQWLYKLYRYQVKATWSKSAVVRSKAINRLISDPVDPSHKRPPTAVFQSQLPSCMHHFQLEDQSQLAGSQESWHVIEGWQVTCYGMSCTGEGLRRYGTNLTIQVCICNLICMNHPQFRSHKAFSGEGWQ